MMQSPDVTKIEECNMKIKREALVSEYIEEALLLLLEKKEYKAITISEICQKAGVTRMSFYRNFEGKDDILRRWMKSITDSFIESSGISYRTDSLRTYIIKLFSHLWKYRDVCRILLHTGLIGLLKEQFDRVFLSVYHGVYDDYKSYFLSGGIFNVFLLWLEKGGTETPENVADRTKDILVK